MSLGKIARPEQFKHLLWRRHPDPTSWDGCRPEILATDGRIVRRLASLQQHIAFQAFAHETSAQDIVHKIETSVAHGVALLGYSMFSGNEAVAILHTAPNLDPGWVAFPHRKSTSSTIPTLPIAIANLPKLRLVGGAEIVWSQGKPHLDAALEQRGTAFRESEHAFNIIDHVKGWEVVARHGDRDLRVLPKRAEPEIQRASEFRLTGRFPFDELIWREFSGQAGFRIFFVLRFDRELFCLPEDWLKFWMEIEI